MLDFSFEFLTSIKSDLACDGEFSYTHITCWLWTASFARQASGACTISFTCFSCPAWEWSIQVPAPASVESIHAVLENNVYFTPDCPACRVAAI